MVNAASTIENPGRMMGGIEVRDPERRLATAYAARADRAALSALWALDETLAGLLGGTSEPMIGQMRLTWWHEALCGLDRGVVPDQPLLRGLADSVIGRGIAGTTLAAMIDGWEVLLDPDPIDDAALLVHADQRGTALFGAIGSVLGCGPGDSLAEAGRGWALIDLGLHLRDAAARARCFALAEPALIKATRSRWSRRGRPIGMLAVLAIRDLRAGPGARRRQGAPARVMRMMWHAACGR